MLVIRGFSRFYFGIASKIRRGERGAPRGGGSKIGGEASTEASEPVPGGLNHPNRMRSFGYGFFNRNEASPENSDVEQSDLFS